MPQGGELIFLLALVFLLFLTFQRGSRQRKAMAAVQAGLTPGSRVMTSAGLHATVVAVEDDVVTLETGPGQQSRWDRRAVIKVLPEAAQDPTHPDETTPPGTAPA